MVSWFQRQRAKFDSETLKPRDTVFKTTPIRDISLAFLLALIIIAGEFTSRRIISVLLPTYFNYFFMDLICLGGFYAVICIIAYVLIGDDVRQKTGYTGFNINDWYQRVTFYNAALAVVIGIQVVNRFMYYSSLDSTGTPSSMSSYNQHSTPQYTQTHHSTQSTTK